MAAPSSTTSTTNAKETKDTILWRIYAVMFIILLSALIILLRIVSIQYSEGDALREKAKTYRVASKKIEAPRGNILAEDGSLLAASLPYYNVYWDPQVVDAATFERYVDTLAICLANYIEGELTPGAYSMRLRDARVANKRYLLIRKNVSYLELEHIRSFPIFNMSIKRDTTLPNLRDQLDSMNTKHELARMKEQKPDYSEERYVDKMTGLIAEKVSKRQNPFKHLAFRTLGNIRFITDEEIEISKSKAKNPKDTLPYKKDIYGNKLHGNGLEYSYHDVLAGFMGEEEMQNIGGGTWVPIEGIEKIEPKAGKDIVTTLDVNIQEVAHNALTKGLTEYNASSGCAVVMEVATGKIRAIANLTWDTTVNRYVENYNYAVRDAVEPGSTFKIASMLALLEDGHINITDSVYLHYGKASFYGEDMEDASAHGLNKTTIAKAFEVSSNVGIAQLVKDHYNNSPEQNEAFIRRMREMYIDKRSGVDLDGESDPTIHIPGDGIWSATTPQAMAIGYEIELTAIQLLTFYNAIANNGKMMKPYLVNEIRAYGHSEKVFQPEVMNRRIASEESIAQARKLLYGVVQGTNGTARAIRTSQYNIAGKTGTAIMNIDQFKKNQAAKKYRASFVGFFPAENPVYTCIVVVTNPKTGQYGGVVAAPIFREIADYCYMHSVQSHEAINNWPKSLKTALLPDLQIGFMPDMKTIVESLHLPYQVKTQTEWAVSRVANDSLYLLNRDMQDDIVPNVVGMGLRDALFLLENRRLRVQVIGVGKVKSQSVRPGVNIKNVKNITIILG